MNIDRFIAARNSRNDSLKTNRFEAVITPPTILNNIASINREIRFWCSGIQIPGYQLRTHTVRRWGYGPMETRPFAPNFQQLQMQVDMSGDGESHAFFEAWMQAIIAHSADGITSDSTYGRRHGSYLVEYPDSFVSTMNILVYDSAGEVIQNIEVRRTYPSNINSIQVNWEDNNQIMKFDAFMEFEDWKLTNL